MPDTTGISTAAQLRCALARKLGGLLQQWLRWRERTQGARTAENLPGVHPVLPDMSASLI